MISAVPALLLYLFGVAYAQHRNQPAQAAQPGVNYGAYPTAAAAPYAGEYDAYASNPAPYGLGYDAVSQYNNQLFGTGQDGSSIFTAGLYGYPGSRGFYRQMNYADAMQGFQASLGNVGANEQRTAPGVSNIAAFNTAPTFQTVPTGSPQEAAAAAYGPRTGAPNAGGYGGYDRATPDPYARASRAFEYAQNGRFGYGSSEAAPGGRSYANFSPSGPSGYAAAYNPGVNGAAAAYGNYFRTQQSYRRR
ncbi:hypothetical protein HPB52_024261 [Rhipicephalus sanguineus]|uniref:Uncharacterized protein n=1 Tax=Rhipicephalus sanguineus TaxID=34632 RepID=A0A9D4TCL8_RHISA|nr:hypothetical protein HPB52_024261 [Rhipicephalus sanguineus]